MEIIRCKCIKACLNKWRRMGSRVIPEYCCQLSKKEESSTPRDVPKGHLVVYIGEDYKRFVIKITLLKDPLFKALLDRAQEEYDFTADSKLWIPCDENIFLSVVQCANSTQEHRRIPLCI